MVRKKKTKTCDKVSEEEDCISKLPEDLISEILVHLPTKDAVKTSLLSTRWRTLWQFVPGLDLDSRAFSNNINALVCFADKFFDSHSHKDSCIRKLRLYITGRNHDCVSFLTQWINAVTSRKILHLDIITGSCYGSEYEIPLSIYNCKTLVHLHLFSTILANAEFVSLPCLKILDLECVTSLHEATLNKLILGSPVLEELTLTDYTGLNGETGTIQVRSKTIKKIRIDHFSKQVVIDAPLLQHLRALVSKTKNFKIISLGSSTKLDLDVFFSQEATHSKTLVHGILEDVSRVRDLVIRNYIWEDIFQYSEIGQLSRAFYSLSRLNANFFKSNLEKLPTILESCPKLESLILEVAKEPFMRHKKYREPMVIMFSTVPECMVSSLKFVELKRSISGYDGEMGLIRYFLKNSTKLEKLRLDLYHTQKAKCDFLKELVAIPRCSASCEVLVL